MRHRRKAQTEMKDTVIESGDSRGQGKGYAIVAVVYLLGIFMGAIDTGILTPCRTVIQNQCGVDDQLGVWVITIYTLAYAVSIPIMGKLADKFGRKPIYLVSILLFGVGSLCCGLTRYADNFYLLLFFRAIQALGGGGIMPVATAEFGTAFPPEKRGMALGLVGGVYGIANVFGSAAGSALLDIFGQTEWQFIFFINVPVCIFILIAGFIALPNSKAEKVEPIDGWGIGILTVMILSLMYGLKNIDFTDFIGTLTSVGVYPYLVVFVVLIPLFILVERRAADPVMNLSFFGDRDIVVTMILSAITGIILMGMIFIPQFAENNMGLASGDGGYFVIILGLFAGIGAPFSGKLIDRFGPKSVLAIGFGAGVIGSLYIALVACQWPTPANIIIGLVLDGISIGFTMGTPINYMMLEKTDPADSNSALATLSLVRSIGTVIAPALMVAFLASSGAAVQDRIMDVLPSEIKVSELPYAQELTAEFDKLKSDKNTKKMLKDVEIPDLEAYSTIEIDMDASSGKYTIPEDLKKQIEDSDYVTIVDNTKALSTYMFSQIEPDLLAKIHKGIDSGVQGMEKGKTQLEEDISKLEKRISKLEASRDKMDRAISGIETGISQQRSALEQMKAILPMVRQFEGYASQSAQMGSIGAMLVTQPASVETMADYDSILDLMPPSVVEKLPADVRKQLEDVKTEADLKKQIAKLRQAIAKTEASRDEMVAARDGMTAGITGMNKAVSSMRGAIDEIETTLHEMSVLRAAVPGTFDEALDKFLQATDDRAPAIRTVFQSTLNEGFQGMFILVAICSGVGLVLLPLYRGKRQKGKPAAE